MHLLSSVNLNGSGLHEEVQFRIRGRREVAMLSRHIWVWQRAYGDVTQSCLAPVVANAIPLANCEDQQP